MALYMLLQLTMKILVNDTGVVEWDFNVTRKDYYPIVVMVDNTTWKLKHYWHPLRRWRISFNGISDCIANLRQTHIIFRINLFFYVYSRSCVCLSSKKGGPSIFSH